MNLDDMVEDAEEQVGYYSVLRMALYIHGSPRKSPAMSAQKQAHNKSTRITTSTRSTTMIMQRITSTMEREMITMILVVEGTTEGEVRVDHTPFTACY